MQREINDLRMKLEAANGDLLKIRQDADREKIEAMQRQEDRFRKKLDDLKSEHAQEMSKVESRLLTDFMKRSNQAEKQQFFYMFDKWRLITLLAKHQGAESMITEILETFQSRA